VFFEPAKTYLPGRRSQVTVRMMDVVKGMNQAMKIMDRDERCLIDSR
jgi:hypothetical protein